MDAKEAVGTAREYVFDLFQAEQLLNVALEEVDFDDLSNDWKITIGFSRTWEQNTSVATMFGDKRPARAYKVVRINDNSGKVKSIKDRFMTGSN